MTKLKKKKVMNDWPSDVDMDEAQNEGSLFRVVT